VSYSGAQKVAFTGSTAAGRLIAAECGKLLRPVTHELGGKSAAIILGARFPVVRQQRSSPSAAALREALDPFLDR
jgi:hypothetical protein